MEGTNPKVVVIGGAYIDIAIRCSQIPSAGQKLAGTALSYAVTGPGPNQAVEVSLCGGTVHLISKVGDDPFGQMVKTVIAEHDINSDFVYTAKAKNTGAVVTLVDSAGGNAGLRYPGANTALNPKEIDAAETVIAEAGVCLIHGQLPQETIVNAIHLAKLHGTKVILNPERPTEYWRNGAGRNEDLPMEYFLADILIPNLHEAADITDQSHTDARDAKFIGSDLIARGVGAAVITMGKRGCMVVDRAGADHIPAFEIELIDQAGRGDAFAGALAAYCAVGGTVNIREAVKFASAAGALACTKFGSIEAMPTRIEIIELLQKEDTK